MARSSLSLLATYKASLIMWVTPISWLLCGLTSVISKVDDAVSKVKMLRPTLYSLDMLDDELAAMALIRSLPYDSYSNFRSSLMLMTDIKYATVKDAIPP